LTTTDELGAVVPTAIFHAESKIAFQENDVGDEGAGAGSGSVACIGAVSTGRVEVDASG